MLKSLTFKWYTDTFFVYKVPQPSHSTQTLIMADSRLAPSQLETSLQSNAVSHWLVANPESALFISTTDLRVGFEQRYADRTTAYSDFKKPVGRSYNRVGTGRM